MVKSCWNVISVLKNAILCMRVRITLTVSRSSLELPRAGVQVKSALRIPSTEAQVNHLRVKPASSHWISDSALLWDTAGCFLHIQEIGANVWDPNTQNTSYCSLGVLRITCKRSMLKPTKFAVFSFISHMKNGL